MSQATAGAARTMTQTEVLVSPEWLASRLDDPGIQVIEVDVNAKNFAVGHIRGALLWNVYRDFRNADYSLVEESAIVDLFRRSGLTPDTTVVFYGYAPALAFWMMKLYRHADVRILDGSRDDLAGCRAPVDDGCCGSGGDRVSDARDRPEHPRDAGRGGGVARRSRDPDPRHAHAPLSSTVRSSGRPEAWSRAGAPVTFRRDATSASTGSSTKPGGIATRRRWPWCSRSTGAEPTRMITYCTVGGRGSTAWFVLTYLLGRSGVKVHDGGWAEWGKNPARPVAA